MLDHANLAFVERSAAGSSYLSYKGLDAWTRRILSGLSMAQEDAALVAETLVRTDARGFQTHGLARLKSYLAKVRTGELNARAAPTVMVDDCLVKIKADRQFGQIAGLRTIDRMCDLAHERPITLGILQDSGHLGALGVLALHAAERGLVGLVLQSTLAIMGLQGASGPLIGNNPLALAAPRTDGPPLVLDLACSVTARGNILLASRSKVPIPLGWAITADGIDTTDPDEALLGALLPFGGHKGLLISMFVQVLAGALTGSTFSGPLNVDDVPRSAGSCNALLLVFNPAKLGGVDAFNDHMRQWIANYKQNGSPASRIPGERAHAAETEARRSGIPLNTDIIRELLEIGVEHGVPFAITGDGEN